MASNPAVLCAHTHQYEVIVVGGGVMGSATFYYLSKKYGAKVLLLERFDNLHTKGSSHGESRIIRMSYPQEYYTKLMSQAFPLWCQAEDEAGTKVLTMTGGLDFGEVGNPHLESILKSMQTLKLDHEVLSPEEISKRFPTITPPPNVIGIYSPEAGILNAMKAVAMFQSLGKAHGGLILDNTQVLEVKDGHNGLIHVTTDKGTELRTRKCVITTGAWSKKLLKQFQNLDLPLQPIQTTFAYWQVENPQQYSSTVFPIFINYNSERTMGLYGFPAHEYPNMIKVSPHTGDNCDPDGRDFQPNTKDLEEIVLPFIQTMFKGVKRGPTLTGSCMYTISPDEDFIIDFVPNNPNILIGCGFSGHGFKLAPVVGKILSELAISGVHPFPFAKPYFELARFKESSQ